MKRSFAVLAALALCACTDATATTAPPSVIVTLTASFNSTCVTASPDPASIRSGEAIAFRNRTSSSLTIVADGFDTPWTVVNPGETSGSIAFSIASTRKYYIQSCGNGPGNLHTLIITVN